MASPFKVGQTYKCVDNAEVVVEAVVGNRVIVHWVVADFYSIHNGDGVYIHHWFKSHVFNGGENRLFTAANPAKHDLVAPQAVVTAQRLFQREIDRPYWGAEAKLGEFVKTSRMWEMTLLVKLTVDGVTSHLSVTEFKASKYWEQLTNG